MRYRKYYIALDENEWRIIINSLNELRNKLLGDGRYTDAVDDVLLKVIDTPIRKFKIRKTGDFDHEQYGEDIHQEHSGEFLEDGGYVFMEYGHSLEGIESYADGN